MSKPRPAKPISDPVDEELHRRVVSLIQMAPQLEQVAAEGNHPGLAGGIAGLKWGLQILVAQRWPLPQPPETPDKKAR